MLLGVADPAAVESGRSGRFGSALADAVARCQSGCRRIVAKDRADIVWVDHTYLAPLVANVSREHARVVDTHDVVHLRDASFQQANLAAEGGMTCVTRRLGCWNCSTW